MKEDSKDEIVYAQPDYTQPFSQPFAQQHVEAIYSEAQEESPAPETMETIEPAQELFEKEPEFVNPDTQPYTQQPPYMSSPYTQQPFDPYYGQPYFGSPQYTRQEPQYTRQEPQYARQGQYTQQPPPYIQQAPPFLHQAQTPPVAYQAPPPGYRQPYSNVPPSQAYGASPYSQFAQAQAGLQTAPERKKENKIKEPGEKYSSRRHTAVLAVVIVIACLASGISGGLIGASLSQSDIVTFESGPAITIEPSNDVTITEAVAKKVLGSVVGITATGVYSNEYFFGPSEQEVVGVGTGMIIEESGFILTNSHVVMDGSIHSIMVHLSDGQDVDGELIWNDTGLDLAIVKIEVNGLVPVELGDSDKVAIGSYVAAIGNPLGHEFYGSITQGVVSGLDRTITVTDGMGGNPVTMEDLIQTDAAINNGNSGGPLLNSKGQVIGINTAKASAEGMGFAIPINTAIPVVEKVIRDGSFERVFMGVSAADVDAVKENFPNVELEADSGACITDVSPGSPAEKAGLKVKDVITAIDGYEITGSNSLIKFLLGYESGDTITITFNRGGEIMETKLTLISQSELAQVEQDENPFRTPPRDDGSR